MKRLVKCAGEGGHEQIRDVEETEEGLKREGTGSKCFQSVRFNKISDP